MAEQGNKITREDFSAVWKDGGNVKWGVKLDLVQHLKQHRENPTWVAMKAAMLDKIISLLPTDRPVQVLEIGCGLGIDVVDLALRISQVNKCPGSRVVGLDFNTEMLGYCEGSTKEKADAGLLPSPSHVSIGFIKDDATVLSSQADNTYDIVRSDIALQHMNVVKTLEQVKRVLKSKGSYIYLEGATGAGICSSDEFVTKTYKGMLPAQLDGGPGVNAYFEAQKIGMTPLFFDYSGLAQTGADLCAADKGWIKLQGTCKMVVEKGVLTREVADEFLAKFKALAESNMLLMLGARVFCAVQKQ